MIPRRGGDIRSVPGLWWRDPARKFEKLSSHQSLQTSMGNIWEINGKYIRICTYDFIYICVCKATLGESPLLIPVTVRSLWSSHMHFWVCETKELYKATKNYNANPKRRDFQVYSQQEWALEAKVRLLKTPALQLLHHTLAWLHAATSFPTHLNSRVPVCSNESNRFNIPTITTIT